MPRHSAWVIPCAGVLAASVGIGRFAYTPILPMMLEHGVLASTETAWLATANYVGYLAGAVAGILVPRLLRSRRVLRVAMCVLVASLGAMALPWGLAVWMLLRLVAGAASALLFMAAVGVVLRVIAPRSATLAGWAFGGIGAGIVAAGAAVLALRQTASWQGAWIVVAIAAAVSTAAAWNLPVGTTGPVAPPQPAAPRRSWRFGAVLAAYSLEGVGYIIAGTFLVIAVGQTSPAWVAAGTWVVVGLAAIPSSALLGRLARRWSRSALLAVTLALQAIGIALPAVIDGALAAVIAAVLFGATFVGIGTLALSAGDALGFPRAVALLTAGYAVGQILGPLVVAPLLASGFRQPLLVGAAIVGAAAVVMAPLALARRSDAADGTVARPSARPAVSPARSSGPRRSA